MADGAYTLTSVNNVWQFYGKVRARVPVCQSHTVPRALHLAPWPAPEPGVPRRWSSCFALVPGGGFRRPSPGAQPASATHRPRDARWRGASERSARLSCSCDLLIADRGYVNYAALGGHGARRKARTPRRHPAASPPLHHLSALGSRLPSGLHQTVNFYRGHRRLTEKAELARSGRASVLPLSHARSHAPLPSRDRSTIRAWAEEQKQDPYDFIPATFIILSESPTSPTAEGGLVASPSVRCASAGGRCRSRSARAAPRWRSWCHPSAWPRWSRCVGEVQLACRPCVRYRV
jgi:hypothetical protein